MSDVNGVGQGQQGGGGTKGTGEGGTTAVKAISKERAKVVQMLLREKEKELKEMLAPEKDMSGKQFSFSFYCVQCFLLLVDRR